MEYRKEVEKIFESQTIEAIKNFLVKHQQTISVAESVTAGFLQASLASAEDASLFFQGGITTYNLGQKSRHLLIDPIHALSCNCVSKEVVSEMAINVCGLFSSDWGIAITGYSAPVTESENKIFAYYAISSHKKVVIADKIDPKPDLPAKVQLHYANYCLQKLLKYLRKHKTRNT